MAMFHPTTAQRMLAFGAASILSIAGSREGATFTIAPGVGGRGTSSAPAQPAAPEPSRQVRRAAARAGRKAARS